MWACALGHLEAAVVLYKWDRRAISIPDSLGRLPLGIARSRGHVKLAECLEHLQRDEQAQLGQNPRIHCPPSEEPNTDSWMTQWHSEAIASPEIPKGVTVIASTNPGKNSDSLPLRFGRDPNGFHTATLRKVVGCSHMFMGLGVIMFLIFLFTVKIPSLTLVLTHQNSKSSKKKISMSMQERNTGYGGGLCEYTVCFWGVFRR